MISLQLVGLERESVGVSEYRSNGVSENKTYVFKVYC